MAAAKKAKNDTIWNDFMVILRSVFYLRKWWSERWCACQQSRRTNPTPTVEDRQKIACQLPGVEVELRSSSRHVRDSLQE
jgi:hypothetical protein